MLETNIPNEPSRLIVTDSGDIKSVLAQQSLQCQGQVGAHQNSQTAVAVSMLRDQWAYIELVKLENQIICESVRRMRLSSSHNYSCTKYVAAQ